MGTIVQQSDRATLARMGTRITAIRFECWPTDDECIGPVFEVRPGDRLVRPMVPRERLRDVRPGDEIYVRGDVYRVAAVVHRTR